MSGINSGAIGFLVLLTITFIVLRLCGVIAWSWWWVLAPVWIPVVAGSVLMAIVMGISAWLGDTGW